MQRHHTVAAVGGASGKSVGWVGGRGVCFSCATPCKTVALDSRGVARRTILYRQVQCGRSAVDRIMSRGCVCRSSVLVLVTSLYGAVAAIYIDRYVLVERVTTGTAGQHGDEAHSMTPAFKVDIRAFVCGGQHPINIPLVGLARLAGKHGMFCICCHDTVVCQLETHHTCGGIDRIECESGVWVTRGDIYSQGVVTRTTPQERFEHHLVESALRGVECAFRTEHPTIWNSIVVVVLEPLVPKAFWSRVVAAGLTATRRRLDKLVLTPKSVITISVVGALTTVLVDDGHRDHIAVIRGEVETHSSPILPQHRYLLVRRIRRHPFVPIDSAPSKFRTGYIVGRIASTKAVAKFIGNIESERWLFRCGMTWVLHDRGVLKNKQIVDRRVNPIAIKNSLSLCRIGPANPKRGCAAPVAKAN